MKEKIIQLIKESPRTLTDLSGSLGLGKEEVHSIMKSISGISIVEKKTFNNKNHPIVKIYYSLK